MSGRRRCNRCSVVERDTDEGTLSHMRWRNVTCLGKIATLCPRCAWAHREFLRGAKVVGVDA